jgi:hypothetical protein
LINNVGAIMMVFREVSVLLGNEFLYVADVLNNFVTGKNVKISLVSRVLCIPVKLFKMGIAFHFGFFLMNITFA